MKNKQLIEISKVEMVPFIPRNGHLGFASCVINGILYIADIAIFSRPQGGIRLAFPVKKLGNGATLPVVRPLSRGVEQAFEEAVREKYENVTEKNGKRMEQNNETSAQP